MPEFLTTREVADLLRIKERKVYDLAASGSIPHSKAMGKLLFPRDALDAWIAQASVGSLTTAQTTLPNVFLGSHDPLLDWALRESQCGIATWFDGSADGLERFVQQEGLASGLHLFDPTSNTWNIPFVASRLACTGSVLVHWAVRQRGLIIKPSLANKVLGLADLKGYSVAPRQAQSGAQDLFENLLNKESVPLAEIQLTNPVRTEVDAALAVLEGHADAAFGLATLANQYRLPFIPVIDEQFDLLINRRAWFEAPLQSFWSFCHGSLFAERASKLSGYDVTRLGCVRYNAE